MSQLGHFGILFLFAVFSWRVSSRQLASPVAVPTTTSTPSTGTRPSTYYNFFTNRWITATTKGPSHPYSPAWPYNFFTNRWITTTTKGPSHPYPATSSFKYNYLTNQWKISTRATHPQITIPTSYSKSQWIGEPRVSPTASQYSTTTAEKRLPNDATLLHQILIQETSLRVELQKTVWDLMKEVEQMKKNQMEEKSEQDIVNQQLINNITSLRSENKKLKDELSVLQLQAQNKSSNTGLHSYHDFTNVSKELQSFKREFRYFSLGFLDIQQDIDRINTQQENVTTAIKDIRDVKDILVRIQRKQFDFSTELENVRTNQTETSLRMDLEKTVRDLMKEFEQMKRNQAEVKKEQEILNQELIDNIASLRTENQQLKDELEKILNSGMGTCKYDLTNITSDFHVFKSDVRYNVSLSLLDFQKEMNITTCTANILQSSDDKIGAVSRDISDIQSAFKNLSSFIDRDRNLQASVNDDILVQLQNISNVIIETWPLDCKELYMNGKRKSGVYTIYPLERSDPNYRPVQVYCDMETEGGGWTAIQRRINGEENFNRNWTEYKLGFGTPYGDYWIGNDAIHQLANGRNLSLHVTITPLNDSFVSFKTYHQFYVFGEDQNYRLQIANPGNGNLRDSLVENEAIYRATGMQFSTFDVDNDKFSSNCAVDFLGGWWFNRCHSAYLTGPWQSDKWRNPWYSQYTSGRQVKGTSMLIKSH